MAVPLAATGSHLGISDHDGHGGRVPDQFRSGLREIAERRLPGRLVQRAGYYALYSKVHPQGLLPAVGRRPARRPLRRPPRAPPRQGIGQSPVRVVSHRRCRPLHVALLLPGEEVPGGARVQVPRRQG